MDSLPKEYVPVVGTEGERHRRAQWFLQLPVYDFSLEACHKMSDLENKRHGRITTRRRDECFGVGAVKLKGTEEKMVRSLSYCDTTVEPPIKDLSNRENLSLKDTH